MARIARAIFVLPFFVLPFLFCHGRFNRPKGYDG
jgi:hypothetical protein